MKEIASALVRAQKSFGPALKTSTNPHFRNKYAALDACIEAVIDALNDNGIMLMQQTHLCEDGVIVETTFIHESGEMLSGGKLHVPAAKHDPQGYGSALTYAKRYSLQSACGIAPEDDDGNQATQSYQSQSKPVSQKKPEPQKAAPTRIEGKEQPWQLKVEAQPGGDFNEWCDFVLEATGIMLGNVSSESDVMAIFRTNKNIFDQVQSGSPESYDKVLSMFKAAKEQHKKGQ